MEWSKITPEIARVMSPEELDNLNAFCENLRDQIKAKQKILIAERNLRAADKAIQNVVVGMTPDQRAALVQRISPNGIDSREAFGKL